MVKKDFRANLIAYLSVMTIMTIIVMSMQHMIPKETFSYMLVLVPVMIMGVFLGHKIGNYLHPEHFKKIVIVIAIVAG